MWALFNSTPYSAERTFARDRDGAEVWIVVVKATFVIHTDGSTAPAPKQEPIHHIPQCIGAPGASSLRYDSDLLPSRPATDVILHGHAYAPLGQPVTQLEVGLRVGPITKSLRVYGDRTWQRGRFGPVLSEPESFIRMPLIYERAFGGTDANGAVEPRNPLGLGFSSASNSCIGRRAPNIEDLRHLLRNTDERPPPAGFGPIASHWAPRAQRAGTYDSRWERERMPLVPGDFDDRYYQSAPDDQQVPGYLKGGEQVELHNLTPEGRLSFQLPRVNLGFVTYIAGDSRHHSARLHAVILEPDERRLMLLFHTALPCHYTIHTILGTRVVEKVLTPLGENPLKPRLPLATATKTEERRMPR